MRLRHIEVFNAIMIAGTVSGAAKLINVSQPAVSRLLQHAELQLGFALFQRIKGRLVPTTEALALQPPIELLFSNLTDVQRLAVSLKAGKTETTLTVLTILTLSHEVLPRAVKRFQVKYPTVNIQFRALHSPDILRALALQEADVGFLLSTNQPLALHPALVQEKIGAAALMCVAPKGLLPQKNLRLASIGLKDLRKLKIIGLETQDPVGTAINQACGVHALTLATSLTVQTYHAALALAEHGLGVALLDSCTAISADRNKVDVLTVVPTVTLALNALRPAAKSSSLVVRAFINAVQQSID
jgi:DNA-binding transcriptional LysR family regulator